MKLFVKTVSGKCVTIEEVLPSHNTTQIRKKLMETSGFEESNEIQLFFGSHKLGDNDTMEKLGVLNESTLHVRERITPRSGVDHNLGTMGNFVDSLAQTKSNFKESLDALFATLEQEHELYLGKKKRYLQICDDLHRFAQSLSAAGVKSPIVKLNIGGRCVDLKSKSLSQHKLSSNIFSSTLSIGKWAPYLLKDQNGRCFFDFDDDWIDPIIEHIRLCGFSSSPRLPIPFPKKRRLCDFSSSPCLPIPFPKEGSELGFGEILNLFHVDNDHLRMSENSTISCVNRRTLGQIVKVAHPASDECCSFDLAYRGTRDGFAAAEFHKRCDGRANTITVVQDDAGNVFGGFADVAWGSSGQYAASQKAFLFVLKSAGGSGDRIHVLPLAGTSNQNAVYHDSGYGPTFGGGHDLHIANDGNANANSYTNRSSYALVGPPSPLDGVRKNFRVVQVEVYEMQQVVESESAEANPTAASTTTIFPKPNDREPALGDNIQHLIKEVVPVGESEELGFTPLYRGTRDGFAAAEFHKRCDGRANTITVVQDDAGNVFGGFADVAWGSSGQYAASQKAFLFVLKSAGGSNACSVAFPLAGTFNQYAMYHDGSYGPTFGGGHDLQIANDGNANANSYTNRSSYALVGPPSPLDGVRKNFRVAEVEIFQCHARPRVEANPLIEGLEERYRCFHSLPGHIRSFADQICSSMEAIGSEEVELLQEALLVEHLSQRPLSELRAATEAMREDPADTCSKIERVVERMQARLAAGERDIGDEIVRFNVQGDLCCIRKSTILSAAPQSQLGVRVSGRWAEQADDLDEDGNIFIEAPRATFRKLLSYLRLEVMLGERKDINQIVVAKEDERGLKHLLDYFMIEAKYVTK